MKVGQQAALAPAIGLLKQPRASSDHAKLRAENWVEAELASRPSHGLQRLTRILAVADARRTHAFENGFEINDSLRAELLSLQQYDVRGTAL